MWLNGCKMKIFDSHNNCISSILSEISYKYKGKKRLLDIGCGDGTRTVLFDGFQRKLSGIDRMDWLKESLRKRIDFLREDFMEQKLSIDNESCDMIISIDVIEHLKDPQPMLGEIHRILNKEGVLIISTPNRNRLLGLFLRLCGLRKFPYYPNKNTVASDPYSAHVIEYTFSELAYLLVKNGFKVIHGYKVFYGISGMYGIKTLFSAPFFHNIILECQKI